MKVLITGISGFVGPFLSAELIKHKLSVSGIDRNNTNIDNVEIHTCDILDSNAMQATLSSVKPDAIIHLAGQSSVEQSWINPSQTHKINVEGTNILLATLLNLKLAPKVIIVSSAEVYGKQDSMPIHENAILHPDSPYAESRVEQEALAIRYHAKYNLPIMIVRSFHHTGPGQPYSFACPGFAKQIVDIERGKSNTIKVGNLEAIRDISDVRDVVKAYALLIEKGTPGEIYNICSGTSRTIKSVLDSLITMSEPAKKASVEVDSARLRKHDIPELLGDNSKIRNLGWTSNYKFEQTLKDILEYWRNKNR